MSANVGGSSAASSNISKAAEPFRESLHFVRTVRVGGIKTSCIRAIMLRTCLSGSCGILLRHLTAAKLDVQHESRLTVSNLSYVIAAASQICYRVVRASFPSRVG